MWAGCSAPSVGSSRHAVMVPRDGVAATRGALSKDTPYTGNIQDTEGHCRSLSVSRNFIFLIPELAEYLKQHAFHKVEEAVEEYERVAPYWFVAFFESAFGESWSAPLYDRLLFQAKAWILDETRAELVPYLDVPAYRVGDLFYIQNLVAALEAPNPRRYSSPGRVSRYSGNGRGGDGVGTGR